MTQSAFNILRAAVIGAGTMGRGIVMSLAESGRHFADFQQEA